MTSEADHAPYQHYSIKHRLVAWVSQRLFDRVTYTVNHGILKGMRRRGGLGWLPEWMDREPESAEHQLFRTLDLRNKTVYDVGAFIGLFALHASRQARQVVCFEPLPRNRERLLENLRLNGIGNVLVRPFGVGREKASLEMSFDPLMPGGASLNTSIAGGITVATAASQRSAVQVTTIDADREEAALPPPDFIKIDIEGFELDALLGARQTLLAHKPALYLEMHGETLAQKRENVHAIVQLLHELGYTSVMHVESGTTITPANSTIAANGHLFCR